MVTRVIHILYVNGRNSAEPSAVVLRWMMKTSFAAIDAEHSGHQAFPALLPLPNVPGKLPQSASSGLA